jgi:hypothetical protein
LCQSLKTVAKSDKFMSRISRLGIGSEYIPLLVERLNDYIRREAAQFTQKRVSWTDDQIIAISKSASQNWSKMAHELTHILDDIINPGLLQKSRESTATVAEIWLTEYKANFVQFGNIIGGLLGGTGTLYVNKTGYIGVALPIREMLWSLADAIGIWDI